MKEAHDLTSAGGLEGSNLKNLRADGSEKFGLQPDWFRVIKNLRTKIVLQKLIRSQEVILDLSSKPKWVSGSEP